MTNAYVLGRAYSYLAKLDERLKEPTKIEIATKNPMRGLVDAHKLVGKLTDEQSAHLAKLHRHRFRIYRPFDGSRALVFRVLP